MAMIKTLSWRLTRLSSWRRMEWERFLTEVKEAKNKKMRRFSRQRENPTSPSRKIVVAVNVAAAIAPFDSVVVDCREHYQILRRRSHPWLQLPSER